MDLKRGAKGDEVSDLKRKLVRLGYHLQDEGLAKGVFGPKLDESVRDFQGKNNLTVDGWVGPLTMIAIDLAVEKIKGNVPAPHPDAKYWKPGPYHPMFKVPAGCTHLHPIDILRSVRGQREILGSKDNPLIAHFHEHSGNLGQHTDGAKYHDEVPHCSSAQNWAGDGAGCEKTNNALAASWNSYVGPKIPKGSGVPEGALVCLGSHITLANKDFHWDGNGSFEGFGSNQNNTIKTSVFSQSKIQSVHLWKPLPGTVLAPIGTKPVPPTGDGNETTR